MSAYIVNEPEQDLCSTCARYGVDCDGDDVIEVVLCTGFVERKGNGKESE